MPPSDGSLSDAQLLALAANVQLIEACPGAGKTRAVVERYRQLVAKSSRGVALTSFTNAAVDEVSARCGDNPGALQAPNFVGTIDTFIHRYIVTPVEISRLGKSPRYLQSWDELAQYARTVKIGTNAYEVVRLALFSHDSSGQIHFREDAATGDDSRYLARATVAQKLTFVSKGILRIQGLNNAGTYDSDSARYRALEILRSDSGGPLLRVLKNRFSELIVDEFQDCSAIEHEILSLLAAAGMHVTVVADPDQAIFGFRHAEDRTYENYRALVADANVVGFTVNYRSSESICKLISSLRFHGNKDVVPHDDRGPKLDPPTIYLLSGSDEAIKTRFLELAEEWSVPHGERVVLAHSAADARKLASSERVAAPTGRAFSSQLLRHLAVLGGSASSAQRRKSCNELGRLLLETLTWKTSESNFSVSDKLELLGKDEMWVRSVAGQLMGQASNWADADAAGKSIRKILGPHLQNLDRPFDGSFSSKLAKPTSDAWNYWSDARDRYESPGLVSWSTIHSSKGHEYEAVLLKVPSKDVVAGWIADDPSEQRRIFYVGASRAERLLVLAAPKTRFAEVKRAIESQGIPLIAERVT